ncbi:MAG TPA: ribonuclease H family protein [Anaerolineales bacterium]|jgi:ribonuclease HI
MPKQQFYVVWKGRKTGVFSSWEHCSAAVTGYKGAEYKAFGTLDAAEAAFQGSYKDFKGKPPTHQQWLFAPSKPVLPSVCVDAACAGSPGPLEYRGVLTEDAKQLFHAGPFPDGTNNVGEFLAIVRAMDWLSKNKHDWPIYSDSESAIAWVKAGKCNTKLARLSTNTMLFRLISRAEQSLKDSKRVKVLKWDTETWGENPADFGRK